MLVLFRFRIVVLLFDQRIMRMYGLHSNEFDVEYQSPHAHDNYVESR